MAGPLRYKHLSRYREIAGILFEEGFGYALDELGLRRFLRPAALLKRQPAEVRRTPEERLRHTLERLGPAFVKIGQLLSTRPDVVPDSFLVELRRLQDEVPPAPYEGVAEVIRAELGGAPEEVFLSFDPIPLAAASIGQVHAAVLPNGVEVAVKVQRPDIRERVEMDLDILVTQARFVESRTAWGRELHVVDYAEEIAFVVRNELDYLAEGRNAERFAANFRDVPKVAFPLIHWDFTTRRVLTMQRFTGIKLDENDALDAAGYDRHDLARRGVDGYLKQVFDDGFFHADPHPGNIFVLPDATIAYTDFGRVGTISQRVREEFTELFLALVDRDEDATLDALRRMGVVGASADERSMRGDLSMLFARYYDVAVKEVRVGELIEHVLGDIRTHSLRVPAEFTLAIATFVVLDGVGLTIDPDFNLVVAARPFAERLLRERLSPDALLHRFARVVRHIGRMSLDLPDALNKLMRRVSEGSLLVEIQPTGYDRLIDEVREMVNRLAFSVLIGSFVIGLSFMLQKLILPWWLNAIFGFALVAATGVGVWLFTSIFIAMFRARRE
jgi:ubiquinone biosynthesis protein